VSSGVAQGLSFDGLPVHQPSSCEDASQFIDLPRWSRDRDQEFIGSMASPSGTWSNNQPPSTFEKLWRGLILVGAIHLGGMLINVVFQMLGNHSLDGIPAKFLGL